MFQTQNGRGGGLRLLRAGDVRRLRRFADRRPNRLLARLRWRTRARGPRAAIDSSEKRAEPEGERVLLLSLRGVVRRSRDCGVVHVALDLPHSLHWRLRRGIIRVGDLVHAGLAEVSGLGRN